MTRSAFAQHSDDASASCIIERACSVMCRPIADFDRIDTRWAAQFAQLKSGLGIEFLVPTNRQPHEKNTWTVSPSGAKLYTDTITKNNVAADKLWGAITLIEWASRITKIKRGFGRLPDHSLRIDAWRLATASAMDVFWDDHADIIMKQDDQAIEGLLNAISKALRTNKIAGATERVTRPGSKRICTRAQAYDANTAMDSLNALAPECFRTRRDVTARRRAAINILRGAAKGAPCGLLQSAQVEGIVVTGPAQILMRLIQSQTLKPYTMGKLWGLLPSNRAQREQQLRIACQAALSSPHRSLNCEMMAIATEDSLVRWG